MLNLAYAKSKIYAKSETVSQCFIGQYKWRQCEKFKTDASRFAVELFSFQNLKLQNYKVKLAGSRNALECLSYSTWKTKI